MFTALQKSCSKVSARGVYYRDQRTSMQGETRDLLQYSWRQQKVAFEAIEKTSIPKGLVIGYVLEYVCSNHFVSKLDC